MTENTHAVVDAAGVVERLTHRPGLVELADGQAVVELRATVRGWPEPPFDNAVLVCSDGGVLSWHDPRSDDERNAAEWASAKAQRCAEEHGGFVFQGNVYQSDEVSLLRIAHVAAAARDDASLVVEFVTADNQIVRLNAQEIQGLQAALGLHLIACATRAQARRPRPQGEPG